MLTRSAYHANIIPMLTVVLAPWIKSALFKNFVTRVTVYIVQPNTTCACVQIKVRGIMQGYITQDKKLCSIPNYTS